jgi:ERCC4-type nuclease
MPTIIVDSEEWDITGERIGLKLKQLGLNIVVKPLDISNYLIEREDKTIPLQRLYYKKYLQMIATGEVFNLIYKLVDTDGLILVEIEDIYEVESNILAYSKALETSLKSTIKYNVPVVLTQIYLTPKIIHYIATENLYQKKKKEKKIYSTDIQEIALSLLMKIPGIGPKTAARILTVFKTLRNLANSTIEDLMKIEGLGKQKARLIYEVFNTRFE